MSELRRGRPAGQPRLPRWRSHILTYHDQGKDSPRPAPRPRRLNMHTRRFPTPSRRRIYSPRARWQSSCGWAGTPRTSRRPVRTAMHDETPSAPRTRTLCSGPARGSTRPQSPPSMESRATGAHRCVSILCPMCFLADTCLLCDCAAHCGGSLPVRELLIIPEVDQPGTWLFLCIVLGAEGADSDSPVRAM